MTTRTADDELLVTADLSGVDPDDITVGFDDGTLVVGVNSRELERVSVPWTESSAEAAVRNGILTVTVTPDSGAGSDAGSFDAESESESETETESETTDETESTDTDTETDSDTDTDTDANTEDDT
ncbi:Hsp20/alpha crystallin family protein [Halomontanus rarus]|uniref:Hsp20/alpha crystallin family protein n=1 Tax=Halomontanus rarus TaxID=3034020 RepID=UPI0023E7C03D|nr:Hsp20/alpha crystallin family protein [Halovivax sp. TS33]